MKTIEEAIVAASRCLAGVGIENPRLESEFLIAASLNMPRTHMILHRENALPSAQLRRLRRWIGEREKRMPLAYVTGEQPFRDRVIKVTPSVLVPRPETELLVEQALRILDRASGSQVIADVGTGSGNIALSLAMHSKAQLVIGIDRSRKAIHIAKKNESLGKRGAPIRWILGNLLEPLVHLPYRIDLIVANLPYVRTAEIEDLEPELHWEPRMALDGGADGLRLIDACITQAVDRLSAGGTLLLEIGADQSVDVVTLLKASHAWDEILVFRDLSGLPRIVQAHRKEK